LFANVAPPPPVAPQPTEDDLDREIEYAFDTDEPMLGRPPAIVGFLIILASVAVLFLTI
jgi:hypothetical protein